MQNVLTNKTIWAVSTNKGKKHTKFNWVRWFFLLAVSGGSSFLTTHHWGFVHCAPCLESLLLSITQNPPGPQVLHQQSPAAFLHYRASPPLAPPNHPASIPHIPWCSHQCLTIQSIQASCSTTLFPNQSQIFLFLDTLSFIPMGLTDILSLQHSFSFVYVYSVKFLVICFWCHFSTISLFFSLFVDLLLHLESFDLSCILLFSDLFCPFFLCFLAKFLSHVFQLIHSLFDYGWSRMHMNYSQ